MHKTFDEIKAEQEKRKEELLAELKTASPERKRELFLQHCPFASFVDKNRAKIKINWS